MADMTTHFTVQEEATSRAYLSSCLQEAKAIVAPYWPISTFIANNPLAGLEQLPFHEALQRATKLRGGQGYLPLPTYHQFFAQGRITHADITAAITSLTPATETLTVADHTIALHQLYEDWLMQEISQNESGSGTRSPETIVSKRLQASVLFSEALQEREDRTEVGNGQITNLVNYHMIIWCAAFLDEGQATWTLPNREQGFYACWKSLAKYALPSPLRTRCKTLPENAEAALLYLLRQRAIPETAWTEYLARHLASLPGWASSIRWREENPQAYWQQLFPITLVDYLAVRVFYEAVYQAERTGKGGARAQVQDTKREQPAGRAITRLARLTDKLRLTEQDIEHLPEASLMPLIELALSFNTEKQQMFWQEAYEHHYRHQLIAQLQTHRAQEASSSTQQPHAQALFCIDVRSEGLRRHLEALGAYTTYGVAGFFGVPIRYRPFGSSHEAALCPALIRPSHLAAEIPTAQAVAERRLNFNTIRTAWRDLLHHLRESLFTPFTFIETVGWTAILPLLGKTLLPRLWNQTHKRLQARMTPTVPTTLSLTSDSTLEEMSAEEQALVVGALLRSIGLTDHFARLVLLCGHGSKTVNNPHASALDCGACGGNPGGTSARIAATILNTPAVRKLLVQQAICIPEETIFLAGEHNTTTDQIELFDEASVPSDHRGELEQLKRDLRLAGERNAQERSQRLPYTQTRKTAVTQQMQQRAADWAQIRPEWGLARNAAFICGRHALTAGLDLEGRTFLHSYDQSQDPDGKALEGILSGPLVVAEWIATQYYFSTVDNDTYGSSTKLLHTLVGQMGVMQGRISDLQIGLPKQSVMVNHHLYHEPLRLLAIVEATPARISAILTRQPQVQRLASNRWISLVACDPVTSTFYRYTPQGTWTEIAAA